MPALIFIAGVVCFVLVTQTTEWRYLSDKRKKKRAEKRFWRRGDEDYELPLQLGVRSMSSGDVLVDEAGRGHYCAPVGWVSVDVSGFEAVKGDLNCDRLRP